MSGRDEILDRIDDVLAGDDQHIGVDWAVSGDAMRSRPVTEDDQRADEPTHSQPGSIDMTASSIAARAVRLVGDREQAFANLAVLTSVSYAHEMRRATGGDVRQLDAIVRFHAAQGFTDRTRTLVRDTLAVGLDPNSVASALGIPVHLVAGGLPELRPNLRLQVINALGLMPVLTRMCEWLAGALERIQPVLDRLDPRPSARRRRRHARQPVRTITTTLTIDTSSFIRAVEGMSITMSRVGQVSASAATHLGVLGRRIDELGLDVDESTAEDVRRQLRDRNLIRAIARTELAAARQHLDQHVDGLYADLGLTRDPHLIRGEH